MDARLPPEGARPLPRAPAADVGLADAGRGRLRQHPLLRARLRDAPSARGTTCPRTSRGRSTASASPRPSASSSSGVGAQYESEVVYHQVREDLEKQGVIFMDMDSALREHEDLVREYFATIIPPNDNKLAALNSAVWSGGSFVYVPPGVHVEMPLQAYFRINTENMGQFERTLIIADEGSYVHYVEGCTAPTYSSDSLHSAVVELIAKPGARIRYTTVQNWSTERLQPRHQARGRGDRRDGRVGRLQPRLEADDEVPERLPDRASGPTARSCRSRSPATASTRTPAARSSTPRRTRPRTSSPSRSPRTAGAAPTAACSRSPRARTARARRSSATRCCSTSTRARTPTRRSGSARTTSTSATRRPSRRSARSSSST